MRVFGVPSAAVHPIIVNATDWRFQWCRQIPQTRPSIHHGIVVAHIGRSALSGSSIHGPTGNDKAATVRNGRRTSVSAWFGQIGFWLPHVLKGNVFDQCVNVAILFIFTVLSAHDEMP